jgi:hypothetical protein
MAIHGWLEVCKRPARGWYAPRSTPCQLMSGSCYILLAMALLTSSVLTNDEFTSSRWLPGEPWTVLRQSAYASATPHLGLTPASALSALADRAMCSTLSNVLNLVDGKWQSMGVLLHLACGHTSIPDTTRSTGLSSKHWQVVRSVTCGLS